MCTSYTLMFLMETSMVEFTTLPNWKFYVGHFGLKLLRKSNEWDFVTQNDHDWWKQN